MSRIATVVNDLRNGLGAIKLRSDVKKVTLVFSGKSDNSGARYYFYYYPHTTFGGGNIGTRPRKEADENRMLMKGGGGVGRMENEERIRKEVAWHGQEGGSSSGDETNH